MKDTHVSRSYTPYCCSVDNGSTGQAETCTLFFSSPEAWTPWEHSPASEVRTHLDVRSCISQSLHGLQTLSPTSEQPYVRVTCHRRTLNVTFDLSICVRRSTFLPRWRQHAHLHAPPTNPPAALHVATLPTSCTESRPWLRFRHIRWLDQAGISRTPRGDARRKSAL